MLCLGPNSHGAVCGLLLLLHPWQPPQGFRCQRHLAVRSATACCCAPFVISMLRLNAACRCNRAVPSMLVSQSAVPSAV